MFHGKKSLLPDKKNRISGEESFRANKDTPTSSQ